MSKKTYRVYFKLILSGGDIAEGEHPIDASESSKKDVILRKFKNTYLEKYKLTMRDCTLKILDDKDPPVKYRYIEAVR